jgi:hypothetical protein
VNATGERSEFLVSRNAWMKLPVLPLAVPSCLAFQCSVPTLFLDSPRDFSWSLLVRLGKTLDFSQPALLESIGIEDSDP